MRQTSQLLACTRPLHPDPWFLLFCVPHFFVLVDLVDLGDTRQVLQVYANRSNARWLEAESWGPPNVVDANHAAASGKFQVPA